MWQRAFDLPPDRDQFGSDGYGYFFRGDGPDVEPHRSMHALEALRWDAFSSQFTENRNRLAAGTGHSDVACLRLDRPAQHAHVITMPASDDYDVCRLTRSQVHHGLVEVFGD